MKIGVLKIFRIKHNFPIDKEFNELFSSVGWESREDKKINQHGEKSYFSIYVFADGYLLRFQQ